MAFKDIQELFDLAAMDLAEGAGAMTCANRSLRFQRSPDEGKEMRKQPLGQSFFHGKTVFYYIGQDEHIRVF